MGRTRVIVIGAGIIGAACARELADAGCAVTVLERGQAAGATSAHGEGNVLVSDKGPGPELELALWSARLWPQVLAEIAERTDLDITRVEWEPKGGIVVATTTDGADGLRAFAAKQQAAGVRLAELDRDALADAEPNLTDEVTAAFHYPQDAQVQPTAAATVLLAAAGADVHVNCEVLGGDARELRTSRGAFSADLVINAAGPWAGEVARRLGAPIDVRPRRGEILVTTPQRPTVFHKVYDADYVGAVVSAAADVQTSAVVESTRAGTILLGSSRSQIGFDDALRTDVLAAIASKALRLFPCLADVAVMRTYGGFRPYVPDHLPVIGADPRAPWLWHATGHEGAGIGLSVGTARLLRRLILGEPSEMDATPFRADRRAVSVA